jgi:hypothetical protein
MVQLCQRYSFIPPLEENLKWRVEMNNECSGRSAGFSAADEAGAGTLQTRNSIRMGSVFTKVILVCSTYIIFQ